VSSQLNFWDGAAVSLQRREIHKFRMKNNSLYENMAFNTLARVWQDSGDVFFRSEFAAADYTNDVRSTESKSYEMESQLIIFARELKQRET
jgi:hypothetical protein